MSYSNTISMYIGQMGLVGVGFRSVGLYHALGTRFPEFKTAGDWLINGPVTAVNLAVSEKRKLRFNCGTSPARKCRGRH